MRCLCDDDDGDNNPSRVTSPAAAFHKLMTYGSPYAARRPAPTASFLSDFTSQFPLSASSRLFMTLILMDVFQCEMT